jgi:DNA-binding NtrC family response regulator
MGEIFLIAKKWKPRAFIRAQLIEEGHSVTAFEKIEEAIALLCRGVIKPHLVIVDTIGQTLVERALVDLKKLVEDIPFLICTGPYDRARFDFKEMGFADVLVRPFTIREVVEAVERIMTEYSHRNKHI